MHHKLELLPKTQVCHSCYVFPDILLPFSFVSCQQWIAILEPIYYLCSGVIDQKRKLNDTVTKLNHLSHSKLVFNKDSDLLSGSLYDKVNPNRAWEQNEGCEQAEAFSCLILLMKPGHKSDTHHLLLVYILHCFISQREENHISGEPE